MKIYLKSLNMKIGYVKNLAIELGSNGITANMISPSLTVSNFTIDISNRVKEVEAMKNPIRRLAVPEDVSETVGYIIHGPNKKLLFIPDIDKWYKWDKSIVDLISSVDYAFIDATFYDEKEINYRDISEIPHPFVIESMKLFERFSKEEKSKIYFIHLNHTNPLLDSNSSEYKDLISKGYNVAQEGLVLKL